VLLIGGAGYIGPVIAEKLLANGDSVIVLDNLIYDNKYALENLFRFDKFQFIQGNMGDDRTLVSSLKGVDHVVILAGLVGDPITKKYPVASTAINEINLQDCIKILSRMELEKVVFISTCSNYGLIPEGDLADESYPTAPLSLYAQSKVAAEKFILSLADKEMFSPTILRFATAFGVAPRMRFDLTVNEFTREVFNRRELIVFDPDTWRPYCHVQDFAEIVDLVLSSPKDRVYGEIFNAGSEVNNFTKRQVINTIAQHVDISKVVFKDKGTDPRNYKVNFSKIREVLNFSPSYSLEKGIVEILSFLQTREIDLSAQNRNMFGNYYLELP